MTDHGRDDSCRQDEASEARTGAARSGLCVRSKIWIELDGEPVLGQGRLELLRLVGKSGSINAAAKQMGIPYRKAWTYIDSMEKRLGFPLVLRSKGGSGGGESTLTAEAENLLQKFEALQKGFDELVNSKFADLGFAL
ncbi:winged helix-turn-helix domain-containing protein [Geomonas oryzae]|uniref:winged helix-turn-helix domain-containing protein n=1 Tax=Geomonas oryzae TaxID=2364273 RepID=UPI00100AB2A7|nr:LysR family transcriptional regulator [Geomonas oryzae]